MYVYMYIYKCVHIYVKISIYGCHQRLKHILAFFFFFFIPVFKFFFFFFFFA